MDLRGRVGSQMSWCQRGRRGDKSQSPLRTRISALEFPNAHLKRPPPWQGTLRGGGETSTGRVKAYSATDAPSTSRRAGWRPIVTVETPQEGRGGVVSHSACWRTGCGEETSAARHRGPLRAQAHSATSRPLERPAPPAELGGGTPGAGLGRG